MLYDKSVALQVLGSLVKKPALFMEDKYDLQDFDFDAYKTLNLSFAVSLYEARS